MKLVDDGRVATALIVDDSLTVRMDLSEAFEQAGFRAFPCSTASEARAALAGQAVDVVILDLVLPDTSGAELLREIREKLGMSLPVLMLSTEAEVRHRIEGLNAGADEYVGKPYDAQYLIARSRALLMERRASSGPAPILLVDDSATSREALGAALREQGFRVVTAASGEEALLLASAEPPFAIVVDSVLPGIDGATFIRRTRFDAALRSVPCMLLTASSDADAELRALEAGADIFVRKDEGTSVTLAKLQVLLRAAPGMVRDVELASLAGAKKILAVDDSATFREELCNALRGEGYDVVQASSGEEALELVAVQPVDCVLLDMVMPGMDGQETCRCLKESPVARDIPVLLLTALNDGDSLLAGLASGADDFVQKSAGFEVVKARMRAQLRRRQIEEETRRVRERLLKSEMEAAEARANHQLAETRQVLVDELRLKNEELEAAYKELQATQATLIQSAKMASLGELVAGVAHEINNPLAFVISHLGTVEKRLERIADLPAADKVHLDIALNRTREMHDGLERIRDLVLKLRTFSRIDEGEFKAINMLECVDAVLTIQHHRLGDAIRVHVDVNPTDMVPCYPSLISQAIMNLLSNSIDAVAPQGNIHISANRSGQSYQIVVEDDGSGIPEELLPRVMDPFFTTKPVGSGTGLGLSITYSIVLKHGGSLQLLPGTRRGTRAVIEFPITP